MGSFAGYQPNAGAMIGVIAKHRAAVGNIQHPDAVPGDLLGAARRAWDDALDLGEVSGFRNAQATVLAPTGTISFMMDCDTTGVEPDFSLVKSKKLVGGGEITIVNKTVPMALDKLGYTPSQVEEIVAYIDERNSVVGAPAVKSEHFPIFDCAIGDRAIHYMGHVKMMGAVQPFISGAISKTVNLPESATIDEVGQLLVEAWQHGVKAIAIYRDNCKVAQPLSGKEKDGGSATLLPSVGAVAHPKRRRLPDDRTEVGRKFRVGEYEGYIHVGLFDDGTPGRHLRRHRKGRHDARGPDELVHDLRVARSPVRRSARGVRVEVQPHALRAERDDERPGHPCRQVDRRLHLPLDGQEVPDDGSAGRGRDPHSGGKGSPRRGVYRARRRPRAGRDRWPAARADGSLQQLGGRGRMRPLRRQHDPYGELLHVPRLRHEHRLLLTSAAQLETLSHPVDWVAQFVGHPQLAVDVAP